ncbi:MAG: hypothetical protein HF973_17355 [Chloroflexi bacterium]|nr:hypothetical protein [Chloroflexota bacterium]
MIKPTIENIQQAIQARQFPTITLWNRLEGRPRTEDFDRTLKAEIRDPLWLLARQWQMGEFQGDDAGSPVFAKIHFTTATLNGYQPGDPAQPAQPFDNSIPLEAQVEQRPIPFQRGGQPVSLDLRLLMGRHWLKLMAPLGNYKADFVAQYPIAKPDPTQKEQAEICAHRDTWQQAAAVAGRAMDGYRLYEYLKDPAHHAYDGTAIPPVQHSEVDILAARFQSWFERLFLQPQEAAPDAWRPSYLEYQFSLSTSNPGHGEEDAVLVADEYYHGRLDWYNLDVDPQRKTLDVVASPPAPESHPAPTQSFLPTPLIFEGMPHTRWWTFEDSRVNFGNVNPGTKDLAQLMLIEFGLIYANDWFMFPLTLPVGTLTHIKGLAVTNVFGERIWVEAAGQGQDEDWQRWNMYTLAVAGDEAVAADTRFILLPTVPKIQEGAAAEEVMFIRDEMANMVWGIETRVSLMDGRSLPGFESATDIRNYYARLVNESPAPNPPDPAAPVRYQVMSNNVPENWIPFIPVHIPNNNREIQLQRAALPRIIPRDPNLPEKIRPRTTLLRTGLDVGLPYFVHEEEVPRAGIIVRQSFQRTRWYDGRVVTWFGVRKQSGRGEGNSNLRFDQLAPVKSSPANG